MTGADEAPMSTSFLSFNSAPNSSKMAMVSSFWPGTSSSKKGMVSFVSLSRYCVGRCLSCGGLPARKVSELRVTVKRAVESQMLIKHWRIIGSLDFW